MKRFIRCSITCGLWPRLLELEQHRDVRRLEQAEREDRHHADDDVARDEPAVKRVEAERRTELGPELPAGGERQRDDRRHDQHHLGHQPGRELDPRRDRHATDDRAEHQAEEQVDDRPGRTAGDVQELERPQRVDLDRDDQRDHRDRDQDQTLARDDLEVERCGRPRGLRRRCPNWRGSGDLGHLRQSYRSPGRE